MNEQNTTQVDVAEAVEELPSVLCSDCETAITDGNEQHRESRFWCQDCYDAYFILECADCQDAVDRADAYRESGDDLCPQCYDDRQPEDEEMREREFSSLDHPEMQSSEQGEYITSSRIFSAELECYYPEIEVQHTVYGELPTCFGVTHDGSLDAHGVEFQTPKLKGKNGEQAIVNACAILNRNDYTVNSSAGLHIHLDGKGLLPKTRTTQVPKAIIEAITFYYLFEDVLVSFLPRSRRNNRFCQRLRDAGYYLEDFRKCKNLVELERAWYKTMEKRTIDLRKGHKYDESRYAGFNVHSLLANNHVEIRYHSGTLNRVKILEWVNLHQTILDMACKQPLVEVDQALSLDFAQKTEKFFSILQLPARAEAYFRSRQAVFNPIAPTTSIHQYAGEEAIVTSPSCAV